MRQESIPVTVPEILADRDWEAMFNPFHVSFRKRNDDMDKDYFVRFLVVLEILVSYYFVIQGC